MLVLLLIACTDPPVDTATEPERLRFRLPVERPDDISTLVGVDHDPEVHDDSLLGGAICTTYDERHFPNCYDEHDGSDYLLDGGFPAMDDGSSPVVAAADGVVVSVHDGEYDRCHPEGGAISCDGHPIIANHVIVEHDDGVRTMYWHLLNGSPLVAEGDAVRCGDRLGLIGSSGVSSTPHLHFEVQLADGTVVDPYAGPLSQPESWWVGQNEPDELPSADCAALGR